MFALLKRIFGRKPEPKNCPEVGVMDLGDDPLDPHGDGTLRPGDPMFELMMNGGGVVTANRRDDGQWEVTQSPFEED